MLKIRNFRVIESIGSGSFAKVYKVKKDEDKKYYALKKIKILKLKDKDQQNTLNEIRLLASLEDKNIISYKEAFIDDKTNCLCIVMELADNFDLMRLIRKTKDAMTCLREEMIWKIFIQILNGLKKLHDCDIIHRDLKSANIFLFKDGRVKIGDLNISKIAKLGFLTTQTGTPYYTSPEIYKDKPYAKKSDIWSVGCILYEMCALRPPFVADGFKELRRNVLIGRYPPIPKFYSEELFYIIRSMLQLNPADRPSCDELLKHPIIVRRSKLISDSLKSDSSELESQKQKLIKTIKMDDIDTLKYSLPQPRYKNHTTASNRSKKKLTSSEIKEDFLSKYKKKPQSLQQQQHNHNILRRKSQRENKEKIDYMKILDKEKSIRHKHKSILSANARNLTSNTQNNSLKLLNEYRKKNHFYSKNSKNSKNEKISKNSRKRISTDPLNSVSLENQRSRIYIRSGIGGRKNSSLAQKRYNKSIDEGQIQNIKRKNYLEKMKNKIGMNLRGEIMLQKKRKKYRINNQNSKVSHLDSLDELVNSRINVREKSLKNVGSVKGGFGNFDGVLRADKITLQTQIDDIRRSRRNGKRGLGYGKEGNE